MIQYVCDSGEELKSWQETSISANPFVKQFVPIGQALHNAGTLVIREIELQTTLSFSRVLSVVGAAQAVYRPPTVFLLRRR